MRTHKRFVSHCPLCGEEVRVLYSGREDEIEGLREVKFHCMGWVWVEPIEKAQRLPDLPTEPYFKVAA